MLSVLTCISDRHDTRLLLLAAFVCTMGVYGASAILRHANCSSGQARLRWGAVSVVAAGCTAWATHMIGLLALNPGMPSGFEPIRTGLSLLAAIAGIGAGLALVLGKHARTRRLFAGLTIGLGIVALHYIGQSSFVITGQVVWDLRLVAVSIALSLTMFSLSLVVFGERNRMIRRFGAPLLLLSIAVLHFYGVTATTFVFDPAVSLPADTLPPAVVAAVIAGVSFGLLVVALLGLRLTIAAAGAARRDRARLRELASFAVEGLAICDNDVIGTANMSLEQLAGVQPGELVGRRLGTLLPGIDLALLPESEERETKLLASDGQLVPVHILRRLVVLGRRGQQVVAVRDQRERLRTEETIRNLAFFDPLTSLPNRTRFIRLLTAHMSACKISGEDCAILLINLDRFKLVNAMAGQAIGDAVLRGVGDRLITCANGRDIVARLGADMFAILQPGQAAIATPGALAQRVIASIEDPFEFGGQSIRIEASLGYAIAPRDGDDPNALMHNADLALDEVRRRGGNGFQGYEAQIGLREQDSRRLEADLRQALLLDQFELHYQPLLDARSRQITSAEALIRWRHPQRGLVSPAEFIPVAEQAGIIVDLGRLVLRAACAEAARWPETVGVAVNLSPAQFRDANLLETIFGALADAKLAPERLNLEITEGLLLLEEERTLATLKRLRACGIGLSMDDFGTGYSSLNYLRRFPFSKIKVDRAFVMNLPHDKESAAIIQTVIALAATLGMETTIEGVETAEQFAIVTAAGCDQVQGYFVSRPVPAPDFLAMLHERRVAA